ncbi:hypothetical protein V6N12_023020 [Hibiscus sabdariffa]|uniref:Uncharacterized protein n=1 Tax=Hibiscus sabdariffa TaxID=183260 RepID=A0ABR2FWG2_9ROSI
MFFPVSPKWWMIFKHKIAQTLIDERDGFTLIPALEWVQSAALADFVLIIPSRAPMGGFISARNLLWPCFTSGGKSNG